MYIEATTTIILNHKENVNFNYNSYFEGIRLEKMC